MDVTTKSEGLSFSLAGSISKIDFFKDKCDAVLFMEGPDKEYLYDVILARLFGDELKIKSIGLNKKTEVIYVSEEVGELYEETPVYYLINGYFDLILGDNKSYNKNVIGLEKYNIENYFYNVNQIISYVATKYKKSILDIRNELSLEEWNKNMRDKLKTLFFNYVIVNRNCNNINCENCLLIENWKNEIDELDYKRIDEYVSELKKQSNYDQQYKEVETKFSERLNNDLSKLLCGKCMLYFIYKYLDKKIENVFDFDDFITYLIGTFNIADLKYVKDKIEKNYKNV